jgi:hypothetical protein
VTETTKPRSSKFLSTFLSRRSPTSKSDVTFFCRSILDSVSSFNFRHHRRWEASLDLPALDRINHARQAGEEEELEIRLNSKYERVWRALKQRLDEPGVRLKSQYSSRLYQWAKQYVAVGYKRVNLATLRKVLGLEDVKDNSGRVVQQAPLEIWENVK